MADLFGIGTAVSGLANSITSVINTNKTNKANAEMAKYSYSKDLEMWNKQNAYNDPSSQMMRYQNAGLNPNLIYGNGSASAGNAASMPHYQAPSQQYHYEAPNILSSLGTFMDMKAKNAQIQNINASTESIRNQNQWQIATLLDRIDLAKNLKFKSFWDTESARSQSGIKGWEEFAAGDYYRGRATQEAIKGNLLKPLLEQQLKNSVMQNSLQAKTLEKYSSDIMRQNVGTENMKMQNEWFNTTKSMGATGEALKWLKMFIHP